VRVSQYYKLGLSQGDLDFVDVDVTNDVALFVDPVALRATPTAFGNECVVLLQDFFQEVLAAIGRDDSDRLSELMGVLGEPDETHLGWSEGVSQGRGVGRQRAAEILAALSASEAAKSGLLHDLEDTALLVEGVGPDLVSDLCTNIVRDPLIRYTESVAERYGIPLSADVDSGFYWDVEQHAWTSRYCRLPLPNNKKLILVPKSIVRKDPSFLPDDYYANFILTHLQSVNLAAGTKLVRTLKGGGQRVYKKDLRAEYGARKSDIVKLTLSYPEILAKYREAKRSAASEPLGHAELRAEIDWPNRIQAIRTATGGNVAKAIEAVLVPLTYPSLSSSEVCRPGHGWSGPLLRAVNQAKDGFFRWARTLTRVPNALLAVSASTCSDFVGELPSLHGALERERIPLAIVALRDEHVSEAAVTACRAIYRSDRCLIIPVGVADLDALTAVAVLQEFAVLQSRADEIIAADTQGTEDKTPEEPGGTVAAAVPVESTLGLRQSVALIVTALPLETKAVATFLSNQGKRVVAGYPCVTGELREGSALWKVVLLEAGKGNVNAALRTGMVATELKPDIALFVGVAGGRKDVALGDVVVANKVYNYESVKEIDGAVKPRPEVFNGSAVIERHARSLFTGDSYERWSTNCGVDLSGDRGTLSGQVAPIASGEKVVADVEGNAAAVLDQSYSDTVAVEMEGAGFMQAIHNTVRCDATVVRGVSDLLAGKAAADEAGWQPIAALRAAAVATWLVLNSPVGELRRY
jgi:nucleoside phosphorylase